MAGIGVLALQGDFEKHGQAISRLGYEPVFIKDKKALQQCDKLIIPGGESTTFLKLIDKLDLRPALIEFGNHKSIMGTCAGLIILAVKTDETQFEPLGLIDISIIRNAYGRQIDSFSDTIEINLKNEISTFKGVFIRAPQIESMGSGVKALGHHRGKVVIAANDHILVTTFHPELTDDLKIHRYFIEEVG
jgi:5'-phosphate synthase pdxT subunit